MKFLPVAKNENIVTKTLADETLVYDLETNQAYCLNETCAAVWLACDGTKTVADISSTLTVKLKSPVNEELVYLALSVLDKENLMVKGAELTQSLSGMSRREMVRRVGATTAVAIPFVSSLVAPTQADAASATCQRTQYQACIAGSNVPAECCQPPYRCIALNAYLSQCI